MNTKTNSLLLLLTLLLFPCHALDCSTSLDIMARRLRGRGRGGGSSSVGKKSEGRGYTRSHTRRYSAVYGYGYGYFGFAVEMQTDFFGYAHDNHYDGFYYGNTIHRLCDRTDTPCICDFISRRKTTQILTVVLITCGCFVAIFVCRIITTKKGRGEEEKPVDLGKITKKRRV